MQQWHPLRFNLILVSVYGMECFQCGWFHNALCKIHKKNYNYFSFWTVVYCCYIHVEVSRCGSISDQGQTWTSLLDQFGYVINESVFTRAKNDRWQVQPFACLCHESQSFRLTGGHFSCLRGLVLSDNCYDGIDDSNSSVTRFQLRGQNIMMSEPLGPPQVWLCWHVTSVCQSCPLRAVDSC